MGIGSRECSPGAGPAVMSGRSDPLSYDVMSVYTLMLGDENGPATVSVHSSAEEAWRALDREVRARCGLRPRPRRVIDPDAATRLADAWRSGELESRFWQICPHRLPLMVPEIGRPVVPARH
ncbi:MAG: hypothetical protein QOG76_7374 [Pseudonocardiales bacterium]|jgi:hypothetical protein|nr:hypothetical protein [Pseudonocardiales bacterium]